MSNYFQSSKNSELSELQIDLNSINLDVKKEAAKQVIAMMTIGKDVYSQAEIGSVYTMKVDCGSGHQTQFYLEIVQDCMDNEISWSTSLDELVYYPRSQTE